MCTWITFIYNWSGIILFVHTVGIMVYLFIMVRNVAKGVTIPRLLQSKWRRVVIEILYVSLSALASLCYATVPLFTNKYGLAGAWCWIRALDENCKLIVIGLLDQLLNGYVFYISGGVVGIIQLIAVAIIYSQLPITLREARLLLRKTFFIIVCFLVSIFIVVITLSMRVITAKTRTYQLPAIWLSVAIAFPIGLLLFPIAFLISFYPIRKIWNDKIRICFAHCKCCKKPKPLHHKRHVHFQEPTEVPTFPVSSRVTPASSTFFQVPYTNDFTHITNATTPLVSEGHAGRGYGSVSASN